MVSSKRRKRHLQHRADYYWKGFFKKIGNSWGRVGVIATIFGTGATSGYYFGRLSELHAHIEYDRQREDKWMDREIEWQKDRSEFEEIIYSLRQENLLLMSRVNKEDSVRIEKPR